MMKTFFVFSFLLVSLFAAKAEANWEYISDQWTYGRNGNCKANSIKVWPSGKYSKIYCGKNYQGIVPEGMMLKLNEVMVILMKRFYGKMECDEVTHPSHTWNVQFKLPDHELRQMFYQDGAICYRGGDVYYEGTEDSIYQNIESLLLDIATNEK